MQKKQMYDRYYNEFENELHRTVTSFLFWKCLNDRPHGDKSVLAALNKTPTSWLTARHALHVTFFITLGRIFDKRKDAFTVITLLKYCENNIEIFSKNNLRERKLADFRDEPDGLDDYISNAYEPTKKDFEGLISQTETYKELFNDIYQPIRHKLIAHKSKSHLDKADELYKQTRIDDVNQILEFLNSIKEALFYLYMNGRKPDLSAYRLDREFYENDFNDLMELLKNA